MTTEELKQFIRDKLGEGVVKVELTEENIQTAIKEALLWFNANKGLLRSMKLSIDNTYEVELPGEVKAIYGVYITERGLGGILGGMAEIMRDFGWAPGLVPVPRGKLPAFAGVVLFLQKLETVYRIAGRDCSWEFKNGKLYLYPREGKMITGDVWIDYKADAEAIEDIESPIDIDLVVRYAVASAKEILGRIRGKYSSYPAAEGTVELDASQLLSEAREEKEKLSTEIIEKALPIAFITG